MTNRPKLNYADNFRQVFRALSDYRDKFDKFGDAYSIRKP